MGIRPCEDTSVRALLLYFKMLSISNIIISRGTAFSGRHFLCNFSRSFAHRGARYFFSARDFAKRQKSLLRNKLCLYDCSSIFQTVSESRLGLACERNLRLRPSKA